MAPDEPQQRIPDEAASDQARERYTAARDDPDRMLNAEGAGEELA